MGSRAGVYDFGAAFLRLMFSAKSICNMPFVVGNHGGINTDGLPPQKCRCQMNHVNRRPLVVPNGALPTRDALRQFLPAALFFGRA
jgi:hypothetical protein